MAELGPITVYADVRWVVDYLSYARGFHETREEAVAVATKAAIDEGRELVVLDRDRIADERERLADQRDAIADERDRLADIRDRNLTR